MKKNFKRWLLASGLLGIMFTLSGCVQTKDGVPTGDGMVYKLLVSPMSSFIDYFVNMFSGNYGLAIIVFTLIVRGILLPLGLQQTKKSTYQAEKMQFLKPQMDAIQAKVKVAVTPEEKVTANQELQSLYKDNNMSMFGGIGCLPLLIQMPIFTALFYTIKFMPGINDATFFKVELGSPSMIFTVLATLSYLLQSYLSMLSVPEEQKKQMRAMLLMSPLMIGFISLSSPAGVTLYWVVGGIISCVQTLITNLYQKPRIKAQVAEEFRKNPPKQVVVPVVKPQAAKPVEPQSTRNQSAQPRNGKSQAGRNSGRQQNR